MTDKQAMTDETMPEPTLFSLIEAGHYAEFQAEDRIAEILGVELLGISFDTYDSSFEIYPDSGVSDVTVSDEQHAALLALGCSRYWINFENGDERYCQGNRISKNSDRWKRHNSYTEQKRSQAEQAAATLRQAVKRARREALEEARKAVLSEVLHLEVVNCEEDVAYNTAINDAQNAIRKLMEDEQ